MKFAYNTIYENIIMGTAQAETFDVNAIICAHRVSKTALNDIENEKHSPTLLQLERIAKGMQCKMSDLYDSPYK